MVRSTARRDRDVSLTVAGCRCCGLTVESGIKLEAEHTVPWTKPSTLWRCSRLQPAEKVGRGPTVRSASCSEFHPSASAMKLFPCELPTSFSTLLYCLGQRFHHKNKFYQRLSRILAKRTSNVAMRNNPDVSVIPSQWTWRP